MHIEKGILPHPKSRNRASKRLALSLLLNSTHNGLHRFRTNLRLPQTNPLNNLIKIMRQLLTLNILSAVHLVLYLVLNTASSTPTAMIVASKPAIAGMK